MVQLLIEILKRGRSLLLVALVSAIGVATWRIVVSREYAAHATFVETNLHNSAVLSGLASQLGLSILQNEGSFSPVFYANLVTSDHVLASAIAGLSTSPAESYEHLGDVIGIKSDTGVVLRQEVIRRIRPRIEATADSRTGIVAVTVELPDRSMALRLLSLLVENVEAFDVTSRQNTARIEAAYTEQRLRELRLRVDSAGARYARFLTANRGISGSPEKQLEQDQLSRELSFEQQVYVSLAESLEEARLQEDRDTPAILEVDAPWVSARRVRSHAAEWAAGAFVLTLCFGIVFVWYLDALRSEIDRATDEQRRMLREAIQRYSRKGRR